MKCTCGAGMHAVDWGGQVNAVCIVCGKHGLGDGIVWECDAECGGKACGRHGALETENRRPGTHQGL